MANIKIINGEITSMTEGITFNDTTNTATGTDSVAFGNKTTASANYSFASGYFSDAPSPTSFVFGYTCMAGGTQAAVIGGIDNSISDGIGAATNSFIGGGSSNGITALNVSTMNSAIIGGTSGNITNGSGNGIVGGFGNMMIGGSTNQVTYSFIGGGNTNAISGSSTTFQYNAIVGGSLNKIYTTTNSVGDSNAIIAGINNEIRNANNSVIINGTNITLTASNETYIGGIKRGGYVLSNTLIAAVSSSSSVPTNISGWSFNALNGSIYRVTIIGTYQTAALTTGGRLKIGGTATCVVNGVFRGAIASTAVATELAQPAVSMTSEFITTSVSNVNTPHYITADIIFMCTANGTILFQWGSEVALSAAQLNMGSAIIVEKIN